MENDNNKLICAKCGAELEVDAFFCSECGAPRSNNEKAPQDDAPKEEIAVVSQPEVPKEEPMISEVSQDTGLAGASEPETLASETDVPKENTLADELPRVGLQKEEMTIVEPLAEEQITTEPQKEEASIAEPFKTIESIGEEVQPKLSQAETLAPAAASHPKQKFCLHCGATLPPDALFCLSCGTKLDNAAQIHPIAPPQAIALQMQQKQQQTSPQPQGYPQQSMPPGYAQPQPQVIIAQAPKSMGLALLLTFLFGPLGLLYATVPGGLIMMCIGFVVGFITFGLGFLIIWPISMVWAYMAVDKYNKALMSGQMPPQSF